jgi:hypothetical protein
VDEDETILKAAMRRLIEDAKQLRRAAVPLYRLDDSRRMVQYGSATCLEYKRMRYICTAAHCLEKESPIYVQGRPGRFIPLDLLFCAVPKWDVAVAKLGDDLLGEIDIERFVGDRDIRLYDTEADLFFGAAIGWPVSKSKPRRGASTTKITPMAIFNVLEFRWPSVVLNFEKKNMEALDGVVFTAPDPTGISGGPIFSHGIGPAPKTELCGIATNWIRPERQIEGTDIRVVLKAIEDGLLDQPGALPAA